MYNPNLNSLYVCVPNASGHPNASLLIEFIVYAENNVFNEDLSNDKSNQITVAWVSVPLTQLDKQTKPLKLDL